MTVISEQEIPKTTVSSKAPDVESIEDLEYGQGARERLQGTLHITKPSGRNLSV